MKERVDIRKFIENEIIRFHDNKLKLERLRNEIISAGSISDDSGIRSGIGDPTARKAEQLTSTNYLIELERRIKAIAKVVADIEMNQPEKLRLLELRFFTHPRRYTEYGTYRSLNISRRTYYRWVNEIINSVGIELGLM